MAKYIINYDLEAGVVIGPTPHQPSDGLVGYWYLQAGDAATELVRQADPRIDAIVTRLIADGHEWQLVPAHEPVPYAQTTEADPAFAVALEAHAIEMLR